jgi:hypothetical protein
MVSIDSCCLYKPAQTLDEIFDACRTSIGENKNKDVSLRCDKHDFFQLTGVLASVIHGAHASGLFRAGALL